MRIKIKIEYDGTNFCGWQIQPNGRSVQEELELATEKITGVRLKVTGSGRTDSGVHAEGQIAHFDTEATIPPERFAAALNAVLPGDVKVLESGEAADDFNARFSAKRKTYRYKMYSSRFSHPLKDRYSVWMDHDLDCEKMNEAAARFVGEHDFRCFLAADSDVESTVRTIYSATVERRGEDISFTVEGNGFLYNMVRIMAGTLLAVGEGKITIEDVDKILDGKDRKFAGKTMPARGLTLLNVFYE